MKFDATKLARFTPLRFVSGQMLTADDLRAEQQYQREMQWQHNRMLHGYGIVAGLEAAIEQNENGSAHVVIAPGYALDGWGRELIVYESLRIPLSQDRRDFVAYVRYVEANAESETASSNVQVLFEPPAERLSAPTARDDFAIPLARFRKPHTEWQHDRNFRPPRAK
ncbi:MAG: hypothetical protein HY741_20345 [Chloroflexi bacterium]|nr:hypothetical protein [Chloroflexota bacterium]